MCNCIGFDLLFIALYIHSFIYNDYQSQSVVYHNVNQALINNHFPSFPSSSSSQRCKVPSVNQETGAVDKLGPLDILRLYRAPAGPDKAMFGVFGLVLQSGKVIKLGDTIKILELKK